MDFSEYSMPVIQYALDFTKDSSAEIRLLHVFDDPFVDRDLGPVSSTNKVSAYTEQLIHKMESDAKLQMEELLKTVRVATKDRPESTFLLSSAIIRGLAADQIVLAAHTWHPHLVIMGSRGHSKLDKIIFGTVTQSVIKQSRVPVLALPLRYTFQPLKNILYGTNFHNYDVYAIGKLMNLLQDADCKYHITHFNLDDDLESDEEKMLELHDQVEHDHRNAKMHFEIVSTEKLLPAFEEFISDYRIDLVALTARRMNKWQSLFTTSQTFHLLGNMKKPLLVFHEV